MAVVTMKQLLEAGVHFGHQTRRWNPKMKEYIFTQRNGIHIIDLQKSSRKLDQAYNYVIELSKEGKDVLFVSTKKQAQESITMHAKRVGMPYVNYRWLGGMITNFKTIRKNIDKIEHFEKMEENGTLDVLPKKEVMLLRKDYDKLVRNLGGIRYMKSLPGAIFVVDPKKEHIAVLEARKLGIPVIAIVDTNCDPDEIDVIIPANDDAIRAVALITQVIANAIMEGRQGDVHEYEGGHVPGQTAINEHEDKDEKPQNNVAVPPNTSSGNIDQT